MGHLSIILVFGRQEQEDFEASLSSEMIPGQLVLHSESLSQKTEKEPGDNLVGNSAYCTNMKTEFESPSLMKSRYGCICL